MPKTVDEIIESMERKIIEIDNLQSILRDAEFSHGDTSWTCRHPRIRAHFSPKDGGGYNIRFRRNDGPTVFPITVTLEAFTDTNGYPTLERKEKRIFHNREEWAEVADWLRKAHWGQLTQ